MLDWATINKMSWSIQNQYTTSFQTRWYSLPLCLTIDDSPHLHVVTPRILSRVGERPAASYCLFGKDHFINRFASSNITRSKEEAIKILRHIRAENPDDPGRSGDKFKRARQLKHSDVRPTSGSDVGPGQMQKPFEDGTYALEVGQISDVVSTDSGVH